MMKCAVVAMLAVAAVGVTANSWAQETDQILFQVPVTLKATLSDKTKVTEADLGGNLSIVKAVYIYSEDDTIGTDTVYVIGSSIGTTNVVSGSTTNTYLTGVAVWQRSTSVDLSKEGATTDKSLSAWSSDNDDGYGLYDLYSETNLNSSIISNSAVLVQLSVKESAKGTNVTGKITGIAYDDSTTIKGSIKNAKVK